MTESLRVEIAQNLTLIVDMCSRLEEQAAVDALRGPVSESEAMMALGAVGNTEAAQNRLEAAESAHLADPTRYDYPVHVEDWTEDEPPLLVLATWEDAIRDERGEPTDLKATVERAADYLRRTIDWMLGVDDQGDANFLAVDELRTDLRRCKARLENILTEGIRSERTKTPCRHDECAGALLVKVWGHYAHGDGYRCPSCHEFYDHDQFKRAQAIHLDSMDADAWVKIADAAHSIGRPVRTVRTWMDRGRVDHERQGVHRTLVVWWPDVRDCHREAVQRDTVRQLRRSA